MASEDAPLLESGDLRICPARGEVGNSRGEAARLGLVNMKVLALLLSRPGQVVSRRELFDAVWPNQAVSDDALTRCISDIRAELGRLSAHDGHIETLPKRGYRWIGDVRAVASGPENVRLEPSAGDEPAVAERRPPRPGRRAVLRWAGRGLAYLAALVLIATLGVRLMDRLARPGLPIIAVLPMRAEASELGLAARVEEAISEYMIDLEQVELLSRTAVESTPGSPFPYLYYEFGVRWLVESELRRLEGEAVLSLALVDARTGIVLFQSTEPIAADDRRRDPGFTHVLEPLAEFIESQ